MGQQLQDTKTGPKAYPFSTSGVTFGAIYKMRYRCLTRFTFDRDFAKMEAFDGI